MITKKVVPFIKNEVQKVSHSSMFDIIDVELNTPEFGKATIYINAPENSVAAKGLSHRSFALCYADEELDDVLETRFFDNIKMLRDSRNRPVFCMVGARYELSSS